MMPDDMTLPSDVFVAIVGSRPLVVHVLNWPLGRVEFVTHDDEEVTFDDEPVFVLVFD